MQSGIKGSIQIDELIKKYKTNAILLEKVKEKFPKVTVSEEYIKGNRNFIFKSKEVNANYETFEFENIYHSLLILPYSEIEVDDQKIKIYSNPRRNSLITRRYSYANQKYSYYLSKFATSFKKRNFGEYLIKESRIAIVNFIETSQKHPIDPKNMDPEIEKILSLI